METPNRRTTRSTKKDVLLVAEDFVSHSRLKLLLDKKCTQERNKCKRMIDTIDLTSTSKKKRTNEIYEPRVKVTTLEPTKEEKKSTYYVVVSRRHHVDLIHNDDSDFVDHPVS
ncbi:Uncharacterized protein Fot_03375 [Forsythia ovata]|uniref:Uncharacterized protein n=1 Tax=Forsythia ovata TaxID=205694 RepID=A0ABD1XA52_9LAMI